MLFILLDVLPSAHVVSLGFLCKIKIIPILFVHLFILSCNEWIIIAIYIILHKHVVHNSSSNKN